MQNQEPNKAIIETYKILANEVLAEYGIEQGQQSVQQPEQQPTEDEGLGIPAWLLIIIVVVVLFLDFKFFGGALTHILLAILSGVAEEAAGEGVPIVVEEDHQAEAVPVEDGKSFRFLLLISQLFLPKKSISNMKSSSHSQSG